jgi:tRNA pseudouridine55 synthase
MRGEIDQIPPPVSAKKVNGVPAYKLARNKLPVDLAPAKVRIHELTVTDVEGARVRLRVLCSAGTYVRSIAHQLGILLGCGAHIEQLVRTRSGSFCLDRAFTIEQLQNLKDEGRLREALVAMTDLLPEFPRVFVDDVTETRIRQGRDFNVPAFRIDACSMHVKAIGADGRLVAIARIAMPHVYHPVVVMSGAYEQRR